MQQITLISTQHKNIGACNAAELYRILKEISPAVIFEELPPHLFDTYYTRKTHRTLESAAISAYVTGAHAKHIPVDTEDIPPESFFRKHQHAMERVLALGDNHDFNFRNLVTRNKLQTATLGFRYLNSNDYITYSDAIALASQQALAAINDDSLIEACRLWNAFNDLRENDMLQNIYRYSNDHAYTNAVFLLGAAHRKSIIEKIRRYNSEGIVKPYWNYYS